MFIHTTAPLTALAALGALATALPAQASHVNYGSGCYDRASSSFYQLFVDATAAAAGLTGQSMVLTPDGDGYEVTWGGGAFIPPTAAAIPLPLLDDGDFLLVMAAPYPSPFGPVSDLRIHANGIVSFGMPVQTFPGTDPYTPTPAGMLGGARTAIYSWHDYNPEEGGVVTQELIGGPGFSARVITWSNVESYPFGPTNPSTLQLQFDLIGGVITVVWVDIDDDPSSPFGSGHIVGFAVGGAAADPGPIALATELPVTTAPYMVAMSMTASPVPVSTASSGTTMLYSIENVPPATPTSTLNLGLVILSLSGDVAGTSLASIGMPGCDLHVGAFANTLTIGAAGGSGVAAFAVPPGIPAGFEFYAQAVALVQPLSLPNGENAFGATVSNGVRSTVDSF